MCVLCRLQGQHRGLAVTGQLEIHNIITEQLHATLQVSAYRGCHCHSNVKGVASDVCVHAVQAIEAGQGSGGDRADF